MTERDLLDAMAEDIENAIGHAYCFQAEENLPDEGGDNIAIVDGRVNFHALARAALAAYQRLVMINSARNDFMGRLAYHEGKVTGSYNGMLLIEVDNIRDQFERECG